MTLFIRSHSLFLKKGSFIAIFLFAQLTFSQNAPLTISGESRTSSDFFKDLEEKSGYSFFYLDDWIEKIEVDKNFEDATVSEILEAVLSDTPLNFYILEEEKRVFLLQNTVVYDELPPSFYQTEDTIGNIAVVEKRGSLPPPTFYTEEVSQTAQRLPLIRIGKADEQNLKPTYQLSGRIINAQTGSPIPDLAIRVRGSGRIAVTNEQGEYEMELPAGYNLISTSAMGIRDSEREVIMYNDGSLNLQLQESLEQLQEVVVEAALTALSVR